MYRFQQWKNDVEEDARVTAAVDAGGFLQFDRDRSHIAPVEHDGEWKLQGNLNHNHSVHRYRDAFSEEEIWLAEWQQESSVQA